MRNKVMVVDDMPINCDILEEILEISLSREEGEALYASARQLEDVIKSLEMKEPVGA